MYAKFGIRKKKQKKKRPMLKSYGHLTGIIKLEVHLEKRPLFIESHLQKCSYKQITFYARQHTQYKASSYIDLSDLNMFCYSLIS